MPSYLTPGVYVEEVQSGARPIEGVGTAVAAFVGFAEHGPFHQPTLVTNWDQYVQTFGGLHRGRLPAARRLRLLRQRRRRGLRRAHRRPRAGRVRLHGRAGAVGQAPAPVALGGFLVAAKSGARRGHLGRGRRRRGREPAGGPLQAAGPPGRQGRGDATTSPPARTSRATWSPRPATPSSSRSPSSPARPRPARRSRPSPSPAAGRRAPGSGVARLDASGVRRRRRRPHRLRRPGESIDEVTMVARPGPDERLPARRRSTPRASRPCSWR